MNSSQTEPPPVKQYLHAFFLWIMGVMQQGGYLGIVVLMAMESSVFPVPSELVIPPAAYLAHAEGKMNFWGVVLAGTVGSWIGASLTYLASAKLGRPFLQRYGRFFFVSPRKLELAEGWVKEYGVAGVFFARLLPVVRHLIGIPAGITHMTFWSFSWTTVVGSFIWCTILAWFGPQIITAEMFLDPDSMVHALKQRTHMVAFLVGILALGYGLMKWMAKRK